MPSGASKVETLPRVYFRDVFYVASMWNLSADVWFAMKHGRCSLSYRLSVFFERTTTLVAKGYDYF